MVQKILFEFVEDKKERERQGALCLCEKLIQWQRGIDFDRRARLLCHFTLELREKVLAVPAIEKRPLRHRVVPVLDAERLRPAGLKLFLPTPLAPVEDSQRHAEKVVMMIPSSRSAQRSTCCLPRCRCRPL